MNINKTFKRSEDKWVPVTHDQLMATTVGELLSESTRFMIDFKVQETHAFIVTSDKDYDALKLKYDNAIIIHLRQLYKTFSGHVSNEIVSNVLPSILFLMNKFEGSEVVAITKK